MAAITEAEGDRFAALNAQGLWDFKIVSFADACPEGDERLVIRGSDDFCYYHQAEIVFLGVDYIDCPTYFGYAAFRLASVEELASVRLKADIEGTLFCIVADAGSRYERRHFVAAREVAVNLERVSYSVNPVGA